MKSGCLLWSEPHCQNAYIHNQALDKVISSSRCPERSRKMHSSTNMRFIQSIAQLSEWQSRRFLKWPWKNSYVFLLLREHWPAIIKGTGGSRSGEQDSKGCFVGTTKIAYWETASVLQLNFIPEWWEIYRMGTITGASPKLHLAAHSYHTAGSWYLWTYGAELSCHTTGSTKHGYHMGMQGGEHLQGSVSKVMLEIGQVSGLGTASR